MKKAAHKFTLIRIVSLVFIFFKTYMCCYKKEKAQLYSR